MAKKPWQKPLGSWKIPQKWRKEDFEGEKKYITPPKNNMEPQKIDGLSDVSPLRVDFQVPC